MKHRTEAELLHAVWFQFHVARKSMHSAARKVARKSYGRAHRNEAHARLCLRHAVANLLTLFAMWSAARLPVFTTMPGYSATFRLEES